jgi:putative thiamine transport system ATP-binding protein
MTLAIHIKGLWVGSKPLLGPLHIEVPAGVVHTVMGPSGCGKSSLLAAVCGTLAPALRNAGWAFCFRTTCCLPT